MYEAQKSQHPRFSFISSGCLGQLNYSGSRSLHEAEVYVYIARTLVNFPRVNSLLLRATHSLATKVDEVQGNYEVATRLGGTKKVPRIHQPAPPFAVSHGFCHASGVRGSKVQGLTFSLMLKIVHFTI